MTIILDKEKIIQAEEAPIMVSSIIQEHQIMKISRDNWEDLSTMSLDYPILKQRMESSEK